MKKFHNTAAALFTVLTLVTILPAAALASFDSGSTGVDGDFTPTANTVLQIPESGVFNYGTVNIPAGVTVTFTRNSQNTPVTILATGNVGISGTISVNGANGSLALPGPGGPGGFDGGSGGSASQISKKGEGPGGASAGSPRTNFTYGGGCGGGGGFTNGGGNGSNSHTDAPGGVGGTAYGNDRMIPFIGGSGGGGGGGTSSYVGGGGGGGGGALVIASSGTITVNTGGGITANGGSGANGEYYSSGYYYGGGGGGGSGGSIRLVANTVIGSGGLSAVGAGGGGGYSSNVSGGSGSAGRIRLEYTTINRAGSTTNPIPTQVSTPGPLTLPNMPILAISSVGTVNAPAIPKGAFNSPDVLLPFNTTNPVTVVVSGTNIPAGQTVTVKATPSVGTATSASAALAGTGASTSATIPITISTAYPSLITATVTYQLASLNLPDIFINGEKIESVRVASGLGGRSAVTYITVTGKEIAAL